MKSPKKTVFKTILSAVLASLTSIIACAQGADYAVMEVVELEFISQQHYNNPYMDVDVWVELKKSGSTTEAYRIPIFWDGENSNGDAIFRARLVATSPGNWTWNIINTTVTNSDEGFIDQSGSFTATTADANSNPNNHGFLRVAANNRTIEYADGTPFFYTADTSWAALTAVFGYNQANDITEISFQDYILARKNQGFNGLNVIASFPDDTYLEQMGRNLDWPGTERGLWASETWGKKIAPSGESPFEMKTPGQPVTDAPLEVDYQRIVPGYWQAVDERMQFLSDQGFVTLFESVRRHERWAFRAQHEKDSFYNYIRYLWARYGCYNMIFSWVHHDSKGSIYPEWRELVQHAHNELSKQLGNQMPYGQPRTAMSFNTSLKNWERDISSALDIQNVSNAERDETMHEWLRDIYVYQNTTKPAVNLEPFYPGWGLHSSNEINAGLDDTTMAQMQMYGSVLSGGLAGHAWGDAWYAGAATATGRSQADGGTIVPTNDPQANAIEAFESQSMGHLKNFILDSGHEYQRLIPAAHTNLSDSQGFIHTLSVSDDKQFALGFFTADARANPTPLPTLTNLTASETYRFEWWDVTNGGWIFADDIEITNDGILQPPGIPNNDRSKNWAYRIRSEGYGDDESTDDESNDDEETTTNFVLRINSGGGAVTHDGATYEEDTYFDTGRTLDRPQTGLEDPFRKFRYSRSQVMGYDIPLQNGEYEVRLHFAELWFGATGGGSGGVGSRVFDVRLEGDLVEDNLDVFAKVGADALLTVTHTVQVTDEELAIDFSSLASDGGTRHPIINAIEIIEITSTPPPAEESVAASDDLVGHWPLDETNGIIAKDARSLGYDGQLENGLSFDNDKMTGQIEGAVVLDGSNDWISLPDIDNDMQSGFSVSAWVKPTNAEGGYQGVAGSTTAGGFMMFIRRGKLAFKVTTNENGAKLSREGSIQNNVWQMISCTFDGSAMRMYINGELIHTESLSGTLKDRRQAWIGWSGWGKEYFEGGIDDVRLFDNALTEEQVFALFEEGHVNTAANTLKAKTALLSDAEFDVTVLRAYPNPTSGTLTVSGTSPGMQLALIDFSGRQVASKTVKTDGHVQMDLSPFARGIYILRIADAVDVVTKKIVLD
ncbi:MAG: LamG-like jellyroll fold domain-containing protein [Maribacter sp.]|uniref:LamG-like jellyroll fold domain-containing protein n=1 Tax=Maribacter sp. TaxID=1897614 RepID=UPI003296C55B